MSTSSESESSISSDEEDPLERSRQYDYKRLADLRAGDRKMNVFGLVTDFKPVFKARSESYCLSFFIVDESSPEEGLGCVFFNVDQEKLPRVQCIGDIVCLHRVNINNFCGRFSVVGIAYSCSLRFSGQIGASLKPCTGSQTYSCTAADKQRVRVLREWAAERHSPTPATSVALSLPGPSDVASASHSVLSSRGPNGITSTAHSLPSSSGITPSAQSGVTPSAQSGVTPSVQSGVTPSAQSGVTPSVQSLPLTCSLGSVTPGAHCSLLVQLVGVTDARVLCDSSVITVWDGTMLLCKARELDLSLHKTVRDTRLWSASSATHAHIVCRGPLVEASLLLVPGQYLMVCSVYAAPIKVRVGRYEFEQRIELCCGPLPTSSSASTASSLCTVDAELKVIATHSPFVRRIKADLEQIVEASTHDAESDPLQPSPSPKPVTTVLHPDKPLTGLNQVKSCSSIHRCYHVKAKIMEFCPPSIEELVQICCLTCGNFPENPSRFRSTLLRGALCERCVGGERSDGDPLPILVYRYAFKMLLTDQTGSIEAYANREAAEGFIGVKPTNFYLDQEARQEVLRRLYFLTGGNYPFSALADSHVRPCIDFCVQSYKPRKKRAPEEASEQVFYLVFDTTICFP